MNLKQRYINVRKKLFDIYYSNLNEMQRKAVYATQGPLLVLAGAGSGKTTVLVQRIAHIIKFGAAMDTDYVKNAIAEDGRRQTVYNYLENAWAYTHFDDMGTMDSWLKSTVSEIENGVDVKTALDKGAQGLMDDM